MAERIVITASAIRGALLSAIPLETLLRQCALDIKSALEHNDFHCTVIEVERCEPLYSVRFLEKPREEAACSNDSADEQAENNAYAKLWGCSGIPIPDGKPRCGNVACMCHGSD